MAEFEDMKRRVVWHGLTLFLLGLLLGFVEPKVANPRMGLAAHLEGLMNGTFLLALGGIWHLVRLSPSVIKWAYWSLLYGAYANVLTTTAAAVVGASSLSPITGAGHNAEPWQETLVTVGFVTVGLTMLLGTALVLWGLRTPHRL